MLIFPNLVINDIMAVTVRTFFPVAPDDDDVSAWALAPLNELRRTCASGDLTLPGVSGPGRVCDTG